MMLEGAGFEITDLGVDVAPEKFVDAIKKNQIQIVALSALLTTTMTMMKDMIEVLAEAGVRDQVKVIIGSAPVTQSYADEMGGDDYAADSAWAVRLGRQWTDTVWRTMSG